MKTDALPKAWFITGTSSGFGPTLTEKLLARGDRVAATLRKVNALDDLKAQYGDDLWVASLAARWFCGTSKRKQPALTDRKSNPAAARSLSR